MSPRLKRRYEVFQESEGFGEENCCDQKSKQKPIKKMSSQNVDAENPDRRDRGAGRKRIMQIKTAAMEPV